MSLFDGTPQLATTYASSTSETPKWMQDAIFNQIRLAQNEAQKPYQEYGLPTVAPLSAMQQQAYQNVATNQNAWRGGMDYATSGMQGLSTRGTDEALRTAQNQSLRPGLIDQNLNKGQGYFDQAGQYSMMGAANPYLGAASSAAGNIVGAAQPYLNQAGAAAGNIVGAAQPYLNDAGTSARNILGAAQPYLNEAGTSARNILGAAQPYLNEAGTSARNIMGSAQPYLTQAASSAGNIMGAAQPYLTQAGTTTAEALSDKALNAANPYLRAASQSSAAGIDQYMNPYQQNVMDVLARQGARNLGENLLPQVSDAFIKAGQFGGSRMGEFGSRALRDTQEAVLDKQAQLANQGYAQSLAASGGDLARQAQLAGTVGSISGADLSRVLQGGAQYGNLGQTAGQLTGQQATALANIGQTAGQLTGQQASALANLGQTAGQLTGQQATALGNLGQTAGQLTGQQATAFANLGQTAGQLTGQQATAFANLGQTAGQLTGQQASAFANLGQTAGQLTGQQQQNLANLGQMQTTAGQAQQTFGVTAAQAVQQAQARDYDRQMQALGNVGGLTQAQNTLRGTDVAALEAAGQAQQGAQQQGLSAAQQEFQNQELYRRQQLDWLSTQIRGLAPITPQTVSENKTTVGNSYGPSPLQQLVGGFGLAKGVAALGR
jgi:hypothetical protein